MASALYDLGRNKFARGEIHWSLAGPDTIKCCLVKTAYVPNLAAHEFFSSLGANAVGNAGGATRADCPTLNLLDPAAGVCDANDALLTAVPAVIGACDWICIFKDSGADGTSPLLALIDTAGGLPIVPNGGDIQIQWDAGANKIFKL